MTLADYSLSDVAFDQIEKWKNTLNYLVTSCNQTEALGAMIPQLEEFIDVARSELAYRHYIACCIYMSCMICMVDDIILASLIKNMINPKITSSLLIMVAKTP